MVAHADGSRPGDPNESQTAIASWSLDRKLFAIGLLAVVPLFVLLQSALVGFSRVDKANRMVEQIGVAERFHQDGDMMHDALRADVLNALAASEGVSRDPNAAVLADLHQHADNFRDDLRRVRQVDVNGQVRVALNREQPALQSYISKAETIAHGAFNDYPRARAELPHFIGAFDKLAMVQARVTDQLSAAVARTHARAGEEVLVARHRVLGAGAIALVLVVVISLLLSRLGRRVVRSERVKDEFISTVSHELRTPLTAIRGALGLLAGGALGSISDKGRRMVDIAAVNTERLSRLINDLLDIEGKVAMERVRCDSAILVIRTVAEMNVMAASNGVALIVQDQGAGEVRADPDRIIQVLTNLISNAIKFSLRRRGSHLYAAQRQRGSLQRSGLRQRHPAGQAGGDLRALQAGRLIRLTR